jgi:Fe-S cluster assembly protein SufD
MTQVIDKTLFNANGFSGFLGTREEPTWVNQLRRSAWERFEAMPWPTTRDEEWMRTDIRAFKLDKFQLGGNPGGEIPAAMLTEGVELAGQSVSLDGQNRVSKLDEKLAAKGVLFGPLGKFLASHESLLRPHFMTKAFNANYDRFAALNAAFWASGTLLYVPRNVTIDRPLHIQNAITDGGADISHLLVILEEGSEATLLTENNSSHHKANGFQCGGSELIVGPRARLRYVTLQDLGQGTWHFAHQKALVDRDASLQWTIGALGSRLSKVNQHVELVGVGAESQVNGAMFTENTQHLSYHTLQHHRAASCRSDFLYKAALQDQSRTVWRGMIKVDSAAQKTDGYQRNDNLLLSEKARADSIPGLEIEADDVRCTHGSTSGRVDEELIFYARSRGFTRKEAIQMIVTGFFQQAFDRITIESVREALRLAIARRVREYA